MAETMELPPGFVNKAFKIVNQKSYHSRVKKDGAKIIVHVDVDSFELQLYLHRNRPDLLWVDVPIVLVNLDNIILAINYTAKLMGVKRPKMNNTPAALMEAKALCPNLIVLEADKKFDKIDSFFPQKESDKVLMAIQHTRSKFDTIIIERSSKDDFVIDITQEVVKKSDGESLSLVELDQFLNKKSNPSPHHLSKPVMIMEDGSADEPGMMGKDLLLKLVETWSTSSDPKKLDRAALVYGGMIATSIVDQIHIETNYLASAGVAHNRLLAKLASTVNKPEGITMLTMDGFERLAKTKFTFQDIKGFGGDRGRMLADHFDKHLTRKSIKFLHDLRSIREKNLTKICRHLHFDNHALVATELFQKCRGLDESPVLPKIHSNRLSTSITFKGVEGAEQFVSRITNLSQDICLRLEYNRHTFVRIAGQLSLEILVKARHNGCEDGVERKFQNFPMTLHDKTTADDVGRAVLDAIEEKNLFFYLNKSANPRPLGYCPIRKIILTASKFNI